MAQTALNRFAKIAVLGALAATVAFIWALVNIRTPRGVLTFAVLDVGQGDALYIESPTGTQVLLDSGQGSAVLHELPKVMPRFDRSLDMAIESHPDSDHMAAFVDVLARYRVGAFLEPGIIKDSSAAYALESAVRRGDIPRYVARRGMTVDLGGGVILHILAPDRDVTYAARGNDNEGVIVARLVYGNTSFMLTADMPADLEERLIALQQKDGGGGLRSTILKVGHHGSRTSTGAEFLAAVHPSLAVISVGAENKYGHPTEETLDRLSAASVPVLRTDENGTLVFLSDGIAIWQIR